MELTNKSNDSQEMIEYMLNKLSRMDATNADMMKLMLQIVKNQEVIMNAMGLNKQQNLNNSGTPTNDLPADFLK